MARPSHVRDAVRRRLLDSARHGWSIEELKDDLTQAGIPADYSSVFRSLGWLEDRGLAQRVELGDGKARYEPRSSHHEHVRCDGCGAVAAVPGCVVEAASAEIERRTGFRLRSHRLVLAGLCNDCRAGD